MAGMRFFPMTTCRATSDVLSCQPVFFLIMKACSISMPLCENWGQIKGRSCRDMIGGCSDQWDTLNKPRL
jgi:hypothetical protein